MAKIMKTMKLHIHSDAIGRDRFAKLTTRYAEACDFVSGYVFDNGFPLSCTNLHGRLYRTVRVEYSLKAQMAQSVFRTVVVRYKTVKEQLAVRESPCFP